MIEIKRTRVPSHLGLALAGLLVVGCGGSGSGGSGSASGALALQNVSVSQGQTWQINRPIEFTFSQPVDFSTVNLNTINIAKLSGAPALGSFVHDAGDPRVVTFLPNCPVKPDFSDAGLVPGGVTYRILLPGAESSVLTVQSTGGKSLGSSFTTTFNTPDSTVLTQLFMDQVQGPPFPVVKPPPDQAPKPGPFTRLIVGGDSLNSVPFVGTFGHAELENGMDVPLNLYSQPQSRVAVVIEFNQPVNPSLENISPARLRLQYDADFTPGNEDWRPIATRVELLGNCTASGAAVRLTPIGVLPQGRDLRAVVSAEFEDLVGDRHSLPLVGFARMTSDFFKDEQGNPIEFTDEVREEFVLSGNQVGSLEDVDALFAGPAASWQGGNLSAAFGFNGTGGPNGTFDFHVPANTDFIFDTTSTIITGGPNGLPVTQQLVVGGKMDVRNLFIPLSSTLRIQGPNPALIQCSGTVTVHGRLIANGNAARNVFTVGTPHLPEPGAAGQGGGGRGGTASFITSGPTFRGGTGRGAFNVEGLGGEGGEGGWNTTVVSNGVNRRSAGGGGGAFGHDQIANLTTGCPDQTIQGLDAEDGFAGNPDAFSAIRPSELLPWGGRIGPRPFVNSANTPEERLDDFFGIKVAGFASANPKIVAGELPTPWAGAGGGAGGDAMRLPDGFPPQDFVFNQHQKGAGGGGGGGSIHIQALGDITLGPSGRIEARGGVGGRGESTGGTNAIGAGSGAGSGGHVILQTAGVLDLSALSPTVAALIVRGGQGGVGADNKGGANEVNPIETPPGTDGMHDATANDNPFSKSGCPAGTNPHVPASGFHGGGGDGSPGILQIHVSDLTTDIIYPGAGQAVLKNLCWPVPHGYDHITQEWVDHLVPEFGSISRSQSKWIALGSTSVSPQTNTPATTTFSFEGTDDETGEVVAVGTSVPELPPVLVAADPVAVEGHTLQVSGAGLEPGAGFYRDNPALLVRFLLKVGGNPFDVASAQHDGDSDVFTLTVASNGPTLPGSGAVEVIPRYFGLETDDTPGLLPASAKVQVEFQATGANAAGEPDATTVFPAAGTWATDITDLNGAMQNTSFRFFRFRVTFDIGEDLSFDTPRPTLDFLRVPFRF